MKNLIFLSKCLEINITEKKLPSFRVISEDRKKCVKLWGLVSPPKHTNRQLKKNTCHLVFDALRLQHIRIRIWRGTPRKLSLYEIYYYFSIKTKSTSIFLRIMTLGVTGRVFDPTVPSAMTSLGGSVLSSGGTSETRRILAAGKDK